MATRVDRSDMANHTAKLTLDDYADFSLDPRFRYRFSLHKINQIVAMHGFIRFKTKKEVLGIFGSFDLMSPLRSTVRDRRISPAATMAIEEVKDDVWSIGWEECPIGSVVGVMAGGDERGPTPPDAAGSVGSSAVEQILSPRPLAVFPAMAVTKKKRRKRMRLLRLLPPPPAAVLSAAVDG